MGKVRYLGNGSGPFPPPQNGEYYITNEAGNTIVDGLVFNPVNGIIAGRIKPKREDSSDGHTPSPLDK